MSTTLEAFDGGVESRPEDCQCHDPESEANLQAKDAHLKRSDNDPLPCVPCFLDGFETVNPEVSADDE